MNIATFISKHRRSLALGVLLLILVLLATVPLYITGYSIRIITTVFMYIILAVSWVIFSGPTRYISLATAAFFGTGVSTLAILGNALPLPAVIVIGGLASSCLALIVGSVTLRLRGIYFAIFTFGLIFVVGGLFEFYESKVITWDHWFRTIDTVLAYHIMLIILVALMVTAYLIRRSRYGLALESIGENEEAAAHMGVNVTRVKVLTFAITAFFMGAAGVAQMGAWSYANPTLAFSLTYSFIPIFAAVFGGMGQLHGPIIGAVVFGTLERTLRAQLGSYFLLGAGIIMVVVILFLPNGIVGLVPILHDKLGGVIRKLRKGDKTEQRANT